MENEGVSQICKALIDEINDETPCPALIDGLIAETEKMGGVKHIGKVTGLLGEQDKLNTSLVLLNKMIERYPGAAELHMRKGCCELKLGLYDECIESISWLTNRDIKDPEAYCVRALALQHVGKLDLALEDLKKALTIDPLNSWFWGTLAVVHMQRNEYNEANSAAIKAIEIRNDYDSVYNLLAGVCLKTARYKEALEFAEQAITMKPDNINYQRTHAVALLLATGNFDQSITVEGSVLYSQYEVTNSGQIR